MVYAVFAALTKVGERDPRAPLARPIALNERERANDEHAYEIRSTSTRVPHVAPIS